MWCSSEDHAPRRKQGGSLSIFRAAGTLCHIPSKAYTLDVYAISCYLHPATHRYSTDSRHRLRQGARRSVARDFRPLHKSHYRARFCGLWVYHPLASSLGWVGRRSLGRELERSAMLRYWIKSSLDVLLNGHTDQIPPLRPGSVIVPHARVAQQVRQYKPGVA
jgi:hypothetical protein